jgi:hypothetical protein
MQVEIIGEVGTPGANPEWIPAQATLAIRHIVRVCGPPPPEMELEVRWQEHELGSYPTIVLLWEDAMRGTPWNDLERCQVALTAYENGGELPPGWSNAARLFGGRRLSPWIEGRPISLTHETVGILVDVERSA